MPRTSPRKSNRVNFDDMQIERIELPPAPIMDRSTAESQSLNVAFMNMTQARLTVLEERSLRRHEKVLEKLDELRKLLAAGRG